MKVKITMDEISILNRMVNKLLLHNNKIYCLASFKVEKGQEESKKRQFGSFKPDKIEINAVMYLTQYVIQGFNTKEKFMGSYTDQENAYMTAFRPKLLIDYRSGYIEMKET